jgi:predicted ribosome quality control (RQC) complex YloA/Tae2 family protein
MDTPVKIPDRESVLTWKKSCEQARARLIKKRSRQEEEYNESCKWLWYKQIGDSLLVEASRIRKGGAQLSITNVHTHQPEIISMNPKFDAVRNAEIFFKKAKKGKRGEEICRENLRATDVEILAVEALAARCAACLDLEESGEAFQRAGEAIRKAATERGLIKDISTHSSGRAAPPVVPFRHFTIDTFDVYVGKNNEQNDELSLRFARPWDVWMHVAAHAGSHVVVRREKNGPFPPREIVAKAASLAVWFSKAKHTSYAEVHVTERRYVHKRRKAPAGEVVLDQYKTIRVSPKSPQELFGRE